MTAVKVPDVVASRRGRSLLAGALVVGAIAASFVTVSTGAEPGAPPAVELSPDQALANYLEQAEPLAQDGGSIVELGMKPGMSDILAGEMSDDLLVDSARGWQRRMAGVRDAWRGLTPPPDLVEAHALFIEALDTYIGVAVVLEEAAQVPVEERAPFGDLAAAEGDRADDSWDRAAGMVQRTARSLGLGPVPWLPSSGGQRSSDGA